MTWVRFDNTVVNLAHVRTIELNPCLLDKGFFPVLDGLDVVLERLFSSGPFAFRPLFWRLRFVLITSLASLSAA
jgi:hypothetical protein